MKSTELDHCRLIAIARAEEQHRRHILSSTRTHLPSPHATTLCRPLGAFLAAICLFTGAPAGLLEVTQSPIAE